MPAQSPAEREGQLIEAEDHLHSSPETPQEMHERMQAEADAETVIDVLEGLKNLQPGELVTWSVYRVSGPGGEPITSGKGFLCDMGNAELSQSNIAARFGGGKYTVRGRTHQGKFAGQRTIDIAGDAPVKEKAMNPSSSSGFSMTEYLAMQQAMEDRREARAREERRERESRFDRMITAAIGPLATVVTAIIQRPSGTTPDLAALITALRPTVTPPDPNTSMKGTLETMILMKKVMGGGDDGDSLSSLLTAAAPYAQPVLSALASQRAANPAGLRRHGRAAGSQPTSPSVRIPNSGTVQPSTPQPQAPPAHTGVNLDAPSQPMSSEQQAMFAELKPQVDALVQMARENADPLTTADVFFEQVMQRMNDDDMYSNVADFIMNPKALEQISIFNTGVKEYAAFFQAFQKRVAERIQAEDQAAQSG